MPWALAISLILWRRFNAKLIFPVFLLVLNVVLFALYRQQVPSETIRSLAAYANVLIPFFSILALDRRSCSKLRSALATTLFFLIAVGALQATGILTSLGGEGIISFLVERGVAEQHGNGRGITLLSSEPSRAGYEFLFISATFIQLFLKKPRRGFYADVAVLLVLALVIKSAVALGFGAVYFTFKYGLRAVLPIAALLGLFGFLSGIVDSRGISILMSIFDAQSPYAAFVLLLNESGFRMISVYSAYMYGILHPFGGGIGFWETTSLLALEQSGLNASDISYFRYRTGEFFSVRPTSFVSSLALDTGWIALLVIYPVIASSFRLLRTSRGDRGILAAFFFFIFVIGAIGNPVPWICVALLVKLSCLERQCEALRRINRQEHDV
jgi:hypothetical protein